MLINADIINNMGGSVEVVTVGSGAIDLGYFTNSSCTTPATVSAILAMKKPTVYHKLSNQPPSWSTGTDADIVQAIALADEGKIDLSQYWSVGDTRTVSLAAMAATGVKESHVAQDVELVLMDVGGKNLVTPTSGRTTCNFIVGMKDCLKETGYMNGSGYSDGGWNSCARRAWCNYVFKNAIPSTLLPIFKPVMNITADSGNSSETFNTSFDYFFLPSEKEVFGTTSYANYTAEYSNTQWTWYKTSSNRIKKLGKNGSAQYWWERSPDSTDTEDECFCEVSVEGSASRSIAFNGLGLSVCGCI